MLRQCVLELPGSGKFSRLHGDNITIKIHDPNMFCGPENCDWVDMRMIRGQPHVVTQFHLEKWSTKRDAKVDVLLMIDTGAHGCLKFIAILNFVVRILLETLVVAGPGGGE